MNKYIVEQLQRKLGLKGNKTQNLIKIKNSLIFGAISYVYLLKEGITPSFPVYALPFFVN